jgi:hypothetical protein
MSNAAPTPGTRFIEKRPMTGGDRLFLVEIGTRQYRAKRDFPADSIELITLGECDEHGRIVREFDIGPMSHRAAPGVVNDRRYFTPLPAEVRRAA